MNGSEVALAAITLAGTICAGFFTLVNRQNKLISEQNQTHGKIAEGLKALARETKTGNREAKERNGHLGEQNIEIAKIANEGLRASKEISTKLDSISTQNVHDQHVHKQVIEKE